MYRVQRFGALTMEEALGVLKHLAESAESTTAGEALALAVDAVGGAIDNMDRRKAAAAASKAAGDDADEADGEADGPAPPKPGRAGKRSQRASERPSGYA